MSDLCTSAHSRCRIYAPEEHSLHLTHVAAPQINRNGFIEPFPDNARQNLRFQEGRFSVHTQNGLPRAALHA
jgi:hypothetical protein